MEWVEGILRAVIPERRIFYDRFLTEYSTIRKAEGRGSGDPAYYLALPYRDLTGRHAEQWAIRGKTYHYFEERVLPQFEIGRPSTFSIWEPEPAGCLIAWLRENIILWQSTSSPIRWMGWAPPAISMPARREVPAG